MDLDGGFEFDVLTNRLNYEVELGAGNEADVYAVTLVIEAEAGAEFVGPIVLNMLGPDTRKASGSYFMSPQFRPAFDEKRVYLKVFASGLPPAGALQPLR